MPKTLSQTLPPKGWSEFYLELEVNLMGVALANSKGWKICQLDI